MDDYNSTRQHEVPLEDLKMDAHMVWLLCSLLSSIAWVVYITFYNSRMVGVLLTKLINKWLVRQAYFKLGSMTINPLAGKLMFRDVVYITFDYSIRVQDGYIIFRWWRSYVPKDVSEDLSHSDTRLSITLNGFEMHIYNRSELYDRLERIFGLKPSILLPTDNMSTEELDAFREQLMNAKNASDHSTGKIKKPRPEAMTATTWRDLIPVIKIDICSGRFVLGNRLIPTSLSITVEEAHCVYSTKPAVCRLDHFMHFVKAKVENAKVLFAPSLKYTGLEDEPPRYMGEGFVVMMSNLMELYFYMDEPGIVPNEPVQLTLANGDIVETISPVIGVDIKCGKGTDFSYGPWADRQRDHLFKYFFPPDWQEMTAFQNEPGKYRQYQSFDIRLCTLNEATVDILFSKLKETNAMHVTIGAGSYIEVILPWVSHSDGCAAKASGQLLHAEATTSLQYRSLAECESLEYKINIHYPTKWNEDQEWTINLTGYKATAYIIYKHKCFFQDLIEDWASKCRPDLLAFIPYTCKFNILFKEFEIITLSNEYNWIDCSSTNQENHHLAFCGDLFDLSFILPFNDFLPQTVNLKFWIHGEGLDLSLFLPEVSSTRPVVSAIDKNAKILTRSGKVKNRSSLYSKKWRRICQPDGGWIDCWSVPIVALSIQYVYHPIPPLGPVPQADITTPEKEEILLSPMRIPKLRKSPAINWIDRLQFDPTCLTPDQVTIEIEIGSSVLFAYGSILRNFIHLKENIFGEDQSFTDLEQSNVKPQPSFGLNLKDQNLGKEIPNKSPVETCNPEEISQPFDARAYRPLDVIVSLTIHDIQAHLMKSCTENEPPCPAILIERIGFEMNKRFFETELQVLVSPSYLITTDLIRRQSKEKHLRQGHMMLSAVQVRGHAMFSNEGRSLSEESLEYAWLVEVQLGDLSGKLTTPQLCNVAIGLETFIFLTTDPENCLKCPKSIQTCHHGLPTNRCVQTKEDIKYRCPSSEDIKYKMLRVCIDTIDLYLVENGTVLHTWIQPVRLATCNLHGQKVKSGISGLISTILVRFFVFNSSNSSDNSVSNTNTTASSHSNKQEIGKNDSFRQKDSLLNHRSNSRISPQYYESGQRQRPNRNTLERKNNFVAPICDNQQDQNGFENWLEVGCVSFGPVLIEAASSLPIPDHKLHLVQHKFLRNHDHKFKRLWFLWTTTGTEQSRCGCIGGCIFFGNNRNGPKFFKPSTQDIIENYNTARYTILSKQKEFGFGESILHERRLVFHTPPYSLKSMNLHDSSYTNEQMRRRYSSDYNSTAWLKEDMSHTLNKSKQQINKPTIDKPSSKEVWKKQHSHKIARENSVDVPYTRLIEAPAKDTKDVDTTDYRKKLNIKDLDMKNNRVAKPSISDSTLINVDVNPIDRDDIQSSQEMSHSAPSPYHLEFDTLSEKPVESDETVQRTMSLTSENPSEIFYSAEEDVTNLATSQQLFLASQNANFHRRKKFSSDLSIGHRDDISTPLPTHRSDLEIHITETRHLPKRPQSTTQLEESMHRINSLVTPARKMNAPENRNNSKCLDDLSDSGSSTRTPPMSSGSFISAMSSQDDLTLINLHTQINRPIVDSPLLMASYLNNLAQVNCNNWSCCSFPVGADTFSIPLFQENSDGQLTYIGSRMAPNFNVYSHWREIRIIPKERYLESATIKDFANNRCHPWDPSIFINKSTIDKLSTDCNQEEFMSLQTEAATCNSFVVRLKGEVNIFLTPLVLEGLQRMVDTLIPTLSNMHILTVVNIMHSFCNRIVKNDNILKRDQSLSYWSQVHSNSKRSTTERRLQGPGDPVLSDVYEESISTKSQGLCVIPKVHIMLLQSSIIEEVICLSALDNVHDLSCVSLLALRVEDFSAKFHFGKTTKASIHSVYVQQTARSNSNHKKGGIMRGTKALLAHLSSQNRPDNIQGEPILIETSEKQLEEMVITLDVGKAHTQFRRLKSEECTEQDLPCVITAIPKHKCRAMFDCIKLPKSTTDSNLGSVMFECGLEGAGVKIIKRSHFEKLENSKDEMGNEINIAGVNVHEANSQASNEKSESAWKFITRKPPTPKTPKEKLAHALEQIIAIDKESLAKEPKTKFPFKTNYFEENSNFDKIKGKKNDKTERQDCNVKDADEASSCVLDLKSVWFNFASPPCVPITRKINFTRMDWNLLSTASPAITAWMNPSNCLAIKVVALMRAMNVRHTSVAACLMADGLENEKIHGNPKSKKSRYLGSYTVLSRTLQEDPSCQLCTIMQMLALKEGTEKIEINLKKSDIPHLNILRQGIIVLCRQWKNILYNPILFEHQYKNKLTQPINVAFSFANQEEDIDDGDYDVEFDGTTSGTSGCRIEENENTFLINRMQYMSQDGYAPADDPELDAGNVQLSPTLLARRKSKLLPNKMTHISHGTSNRSSIQMIPILGGLVEKQNAEIEYGTLQEGSTSSTEFEHKCSTPLTNQKEDLYFWMATQQQGKTKPSFFHEKQNATKIPPYKLADYHSKNILRDSLKLLDAHLIFEPILTYLGVMPQQIFSKITDSDISSLEHFGTNLSLVGTFDLIRVDIVVSEFYGQHHHERSYRKSRDNYDPNISTIEQPAFICEKVGIELEVLKKRDGMIGDAKHVLYISRKQLKKNTSTFINYGVNIGSISQQVNMPILRLLHQISNMCMKVREAQCELRENPDAFKKNHVRDAASISSETNGGQVNISMEPLVNDASSELIEKSIECIPANTAVSKAKGSGSSVFPFINPSPNYGKNRPQTFAQKLRSTGKTVKGKLGYTSLAEASPIKAPSNLYSSKMPSDSLNIYEESNALLNKKAYMKNGQMPVAKTPNCWTTIYHLLELYGTMAETRKIQRFSLLMDQNDASKFAKKNAVNNLKYEEKEDEEASLPATLPLSKPKEQAHLMIFGVAKIHKTRLLATLSGLKLEAEIATLNSSVTWRKKVRPVSADCSITGQLGRTMIVLLEGSSPNQQTIVKVTIGKSQTLYSSVMKKGKDKNSGLLSIGPVNVDIPQHPVVLHGMMTRSSKQLTSTLQELGVGRASTRTSGRQHEDVESPVHIRDTSQIYRLHEHNDAENFSQQSGFLTPLVMQFNILLQSLSISAALLPSLQAQYTMNQVTSTGVTGNKAKFVVDLPTHFLSFTTKLQISEANIPSEASIALPPISVCAEYIPENEDKGQIVDGIILKRGGYVSASAEIGSFERCLTTDLLNHLVFVQKVFMNEINEVLQKVYRGEKPASLRMDESESRSGISNLLFSVEVCVKRIQLTATTPCSSAVRFETGVLDLYLSNRVKNVGKGGERKLFGKANIELNLSLGQIIKNVIFDEAEPEFHQHAFFNTTVTLRNAFQEEIVNDNKELILLTLKRPLIYIQPIAVDKAILVWLNYKNAYEYWAEKRASSFVNVPNNTYQVFEKAPFSQLGNIASSNLSAVFLQLTVEDMGICLPLKQLAWGSRPYQDFEPKGAVVITLENTIISACNSGSLVSKGRFQELCLRFADDFEVTLDDWKPNMWDSNIMNLCIVSEGTYEFCSRTTAAKHQENAKWFLNVKWQMEGVDIHLDVNIGKHLSSLGHTLTMLTGFDEEEPNTVESPDSDDGDQLSAKRKLKRKEFESLPSFLFDPNIDSKTRSIMMEKEMTEQLKIINDLRTLGASHNTIIHEERRLQELQALCYKYFRRDMIQKWKRPSLRQTMLKTSNRSQSFIAPTFSSKTQNEKQKRVHMESTTDDASSLVIGPTRTASLKFSIPNSHRVTFSEAMRQTSLPNSDVDTALEENTDMSILQESSIDLSELDLDDCELRRKNVGNGAKQQEPNIDFELDIKVMVNSGKCVLHTKEMNDEKIALNNVTRQHKREHSLGNDWNSPTPSRKSRDKNKIRYNTNQSILLDLTVFHVPGLNIKVHYESTTLTDSQIHNSNSTFSRINSADNASSLTKKMGNKRASLFAFMTLQSIPEETTISPHILEFLEQTLEPIPKRRGSLPSTTNAVNIDLLTNDYTNYASFPVDVIVYFHMQPSTFRFSCLPISRVECMLQLPSLDIVFSSKRSEDYDSISLDNKANIGGLSVTGCLADFNLYIFHPYGGKKSGTKETQFSPLTDNERKDSLSVNVEFVKFHITRCRKFAEPLTSKRFADQSKAMIHFSTIIDIGSASFKYDMRRLTEILAFPKAWYRKTIVRRLFLGDLSVNQNNHLGPERTQQDKSDPNSDSCKSNPNATNDGIRSDEVIHRIEAISACDKTCENLDKSQTTAWETLVLFAVNFTKLNVQMNMGNVMGNAIWLMRDFQSDGKLNIGSTGCKDMSIGIRLGGCSLDAKGGIVGGIFGLNNINTQFNIKEELGKEPCHKIRMKLKALELRLDYMGTSVLMARVSSFSAALRDEWKTTSDKIISNPNKNAVIYIHGNLVWDQFQIMISKSTTADLLKIFYKLEEFFSQQFKSSKRIFFSLENRSNDRNNSMRRKHYSKKKPSTSDGPSYGDCLNDEVKHHRHWQKSLTTVMGLSVPTLLTKLPKQGNILGGTIELYGKNVSLACFHGINFKSKSWALFSLREPFINFVTEAQDVGGEGEVRVKESLAFSLGKNCQTPQSHSMAIVSRISRNIVFPPQYKNLTEWFHYAFANSDIDAVERFPVMEREKEAASSSIERGRVSSVSGSSSKSQDLNHNREVIFALPSLQCHFNTEHRQSPNTPVMSDDKPVVVCSFITEFEDHIFVTVDADAFFFLHDLITSYVKEKEKVVGNQFARSVSPNPTTVRQQSFNSTKKNKEVRASNGDINSDESGRKQEGIAGTTDAKEVNIAQKIANEDLERVFRDWRHFECKTWHLEPTVRLLSWAGKSIEPYGIDYILNKLGFSHARITIPKWLQRGFMDPLDKVEAFLMLRLLLFVKEGKSDSLKN